MEGEQAELAANFDGFISNFIGSTVDYHIGVVDGDLSGMSDTEEGQLIQKQGVRWISRDTPDPGGYLQRDGAARLRRSGLLRDGPPSIVRSPERAVPSGRIQPGLRPP